MKTTNDYITILRKYLSTKADAYGITKIGIFGSVARNEQLSCYALQAVPRGPRDGELVNKRRATRDHEAGNECPN